MLAGGSRGYAHAQVRFARCVAFTKNALFPGGGQLSLLLIRLEEVLRTENLWLRGCVFWSVHTGKKGEKEYAFFSVSHAKRFQSGLGAQLQPITDEWNFA